MKRVGTRGKWQVKARWFILLWMMSMGSALFLFMEHPAKAEDQKNPTTGELIAGAGFERIPFKNVYLTPGGFFEATSLYRSANENADVGSTYGNIPLSGSANSNLSEFRGTSRQSRISLLAETNAFGSKLSGYVETDFLGAAPTANEVESNSWNLRLRQAWSTVDFPSGFSVTAGQAWSLLATHRSGLRPRSEFIPYTIDAQYVVGYNWARQFELRLTQDFGHGVLAAVSVENPETNISGVILPTNTLGFNSSANATSPGSLFTLNNTPGANGVSTDLAPDVVAKVVLEPGWGHWELKALGRAFRDRLNGDNHTAFGGGVGAAALLPLHRTLTFVAEGLAGAGIGRYASGVGPDVIVKQDGGLRPIRAAQVMTGLEWHPTDPWDIYTYYGLEYYKRTTDGNSVIGYGSRQAQLDGCTVEIPTSTQKCQGANKTLWQIQPGFWYRVFKGKEGIGAVGLSYSYTHRELWEGKEGTTPTGHEHIVMASVRYYLP